MAQLARVITPGMPHHITLAPKKLIRTRRASEGSASEPSLARRVSMCKDAKLSRRGNITQRGNRRQQTFFGGEDYQHYLELMSRFCRAEQVAIWTHCLMPNHVHLIVVPQSAERACIARIGEAHRRYTRRIGPGTKPLSLKQRGGPLERA